MDERVVQFRVGAVVIAAALTTVILIMLFGAGPEPFREQYTIYIEFPQAPGVTVDTPVRKSGVLIGRVSHVQLLEEGGVVLTMRIDDRYRLRHNEVCRIGTGSLVTGDAVLEFVPRGEAGISSEPIEDGEYLSNGVVASDPLQVFVDLEEKMTSAIGSVESAGNDVSSMARDFRSTLQTNEGQLRRILRKSELALDGFQTTMTSMNQIVEDPELRAAIKRSLEDVPELVREARITLEQSRQTLETFRRVSQRAEQNLENLENLTRPLGERGEALAETIDETTRGLNDLVGQLVTFTERVNRQDSTLGRLTSDDQLYETLRDAAENIEDASRRLRPILDDVRVFTDKIATDPRQLGIKGALDHRPLGVGVKSDTRWHR